MALIIFTWILASVFVAWVVCGLFSVNKSEDDDDFMGRMA
jgi:hypothetical protein